MRSARHGDNKLGFGLSKIRLPGRHHGEPVKFEFSLSELTIHLNSQHEAAVCVDNLVLTWRRGQRTSASKPTRVVEMLDQATGSLSRTAWLLHDLTLPVTLFRLQGGHEASYEPKPSELLVTEAGEEEDDDGLTAEGGFLSCMRLDLAEYAGTEPQTHRSRRARVSFTAAPRPAPVVVGPRGATPSRPRALSSSFARLRAQSGARAARRRRLDSVCHLLAAARLARFAGRWLRVERMQLRDRPHRTRHAAAADERRRWRLFGRGR